MLTGELRGMINHLRRNNKYRKTTRTSTTTTTTQLHNTERYSDYCSFLLAE
jgi:hypothetical protein